MSLLNQPERSHCLVAHEQCTIRQPELVILPDAERRACCIQRERHRVERLERLQPNDRCHACNRSERLRHRLPEIVPATQCDR